MSFDYISRISVEIYLLIIAFVYLKSIVFLDESFEICLFFIFFKMLFGDNNIEYSQYKSEKIVITDNLVVNRNIIIKYASLI